MDRCYICGHTVDTSTHCKIVNGLPKWFHNECWKLYKKGVTPEIYNKLRRTGNDGMVQ